MQNQPTVFRMRRVCAFHVCPIDEVTTDRAILAAA
jgi:hypothetical protein